MNDVLTPQQRSYCMSHNRCKNTSPEILLRKELWMKGFRYRVNYKLFGKPDIVFASKRLAVFIDGCFWHGCPKHYIKPKSNKNFWKTKIRKNIKRDNEVNRKLREMGWSVIRFWEHQVKNDLSFCVEKIHNLVK